MTTRFMPLCGFTLLSVDAIIPPRKLVLAGLFVKEENLSCVAWSSKTRLEPPVSLNIFK